MGSITIALEWTEVDFEKGAVAVEKSISLTENSQAVEKGPKSKSSKRWIDMPDWFMDELRVHKREWDLQRKKAILAGEWLGGDRQYVFHGGYGKPYYHSYPSEWWIKFVKRHALKSVRFHDLRHSSATLLIEAGASMKAVQKRLGHAKHQTTADIYAHVTKKLSRDTAEKFDKFAPRPISVPNSSPR
ncbi:site-specific integrase [Paenibacillus sp. GCM10012307]|uniref:site-specific integrase n=1 Tax=Paenibacillus roseus TaxID=2798579 RepID=UPI001E612C14|nr:site-specific integrase [Paenibacillus roseus]